MMNTPWLLLLVCVGSNASAPFWLNRKVDCRVSEWSDWKGPVGFGEYERFRTVLANPANGGEPCPILTEIKPAPRPPTVQETAKHFTQTFLDKNSQSTISKRSTGKSRDLLILIDSSGSIGSDHFSKALNDIAVLLGLLCPSPDPFKNPSIQYHQAAFIQFSDRPKEEFSFGQRYPTSAVQNAIRSVNYIGSSTCTGDAFKAALDLFASTNKGVRNKPTVQKQVLILTDGMSNCGRNAIEAARNLKTAVFSSAYDKVEVFGIMIGLRGGEQEVKQYVSSPMGDHLFALKDFFALSDLVKFTKEYAAMYQCTPIEF